MREIDTKQRLISTPVRRCDFIEDKHIKRERWTEENMSGTIKRTLDLLSLQQIRSRIEKKGATYSIKPTQNMGMRLLCCYICFPA